MPLRDPNNPNTDIVIMNALKALILIDKDTGLPNTQLALSSQSGTGLESVFVQQKYQMSLLLDQGQPSAVNISSGPQGYSRNGSSIFKGSLTVTLGYYSRWDNQPDTIDNIWKGIAEDLERIKANIESNDTTAYQSENNTVSIPKLTLDPYESDFDKTFTGLSLVKRNMYITYNLLPYRT